VNMKQTIRFSQLSPSLKTLVRLCQDLNFGCLLNLTVINSEVRFDSQADVIVDIRLDDEASARVESELGDFALRSEMRRLVAQIDALQNGIIENLVVHGGVPRRLTLRRKLQTLH
jgi:hypothetical protein